MFASAKAIRQYSMEELVALGVSWVRMGIESPRACYEKLWNSGTMKLTRANCVRIGIKVLGSTVVGLKHYKPQNVDEEIEHAVSHNTDFHQFTLYAPAPGTPLYAGLRERRILDGIEVADMRGQDRFNFRHEAISRQASKRWLDWTFRHDFERNGTSLCRICRTKLEGWRRYKSHPDPRIRERFRWEARGLRNAASALLWAMEHRMKSGAVVAGIPTLCRDIGREFGWLPRRAGSFLGPVLVSTTVREERRVARGVTYEPEPIVERRNWPSTGISFPFGEIRRDVSTAEASR